MGKKEIILNTIIEEYLKNSAPIGSNELKSKMDIDISSSTIRVYFKKLSYEGILKQLHTSSGRIPTWTALKRYWEEYFINIDDLRIDNIGELKRWVGNFDIYCMLQYVDEYRLSEIINVNDRFLLIVFENNSIVLEYNEKVEKFLINLIGYDINRVKNISVNVGLYELRKKIEQLFDSNIIFREKEYILYDMIKFYNFRKKDVRSFTSSVVFEKLDDGIYFDELVPEGYMALKYRTKVEDKKVNFFCIGKVDSNYREFLDEISIRR